MTVRRATLILKPTFYFEPHPLGKTWESSTLLFSVQNGKTNYGVRKHSPIPTFQGLSRENRSLSKVLYNVWNYWSCHPLLFKYWENKCFTIINGGLWSNWDFLYYGYALCIPCIMYTLLCIGIFCFSISNKYTVLTILAGYGTL